MIQTRGEMQDVLAQLAHEDPTLGHRLRCDPRGVVERLFSVVVPEGVEIRVLEERADTLYLVLPHAHRVGELCDDDLEAIAGGSTVVKNVSGGVNALEAKIES